MPNPTSTEKTKAQLWAELGVEEGQAPASRTPAEQDAPRQEQMPEQQAADDATQQDDPLASLPPALRHEFLGMRQMLEQASGRLRNAEGRIGTLNDQLNRARLDVQSLRETAASVTRGGGDAPSRAQIDAAKGDSAAMDKLIAEYPEFGQAMKSALDASTSSMRQELDQLKAITGTRQQEQPQGQAQGQQTQQPQRLTAEQERELIRAQLTVEMRHPGYEKLIETPAFRGWLSTQAPEVQVLANSYDPNHAIRVLDLHKADISATQTGRGARDNAASRIPAGRPSGAAFNSKDPDNMTKQEYWQYLNELEAAQQGAQRR